MVEPARSFDLAAAEYERTRPSYPPELLDGLPLGPDADVLDLGAGTGKLTRVLVRRYARVTAVEPLDGMRSILERVVPEAAALAGSAEEIPLADGAVDAVFAAQAFHWFDHDRALPEIARVLRPGGVLALVWNGPDESRPSPLPAAFAAYLDELRAAAEFHGQPSWRELLARGPFGDANEATVPHDHVLDRMGLLDNARSVSWIASRPAEEREAVLARLGSLLPEGTYAIPNLANVLWSVRRRDAG
ncbi:MAG TPA: class I SAM-dependent methyltransferase [Gaiellaceae bacterium]|nr:class I SAM-dependent methyltransferase [Gaiellaceae bacterium]